MMKRKIFNMIFVIGIMSIAFLNAQSVSALSINGKNIYGETITYIETEETTNQENRGVTTIKPYYDQGGISTFGTSKPTNKWNLNNDGRYEFSGGTAYNDLYTNYLFTGASEVRVKLHATKNYALHAELWQRKTGLFQSDSKVYTFGEVAVGYSSETTVFGLSSSANYYIKFTAPAYFTGWIESN